jgi:hypothetical protein
MRPRIVIHFICLVIAVLCVVAFAGCHSLGYVHGAPEDQSGLWMAALKGFKGPVYYVGSDGDYSYFRAGRVFYRRYKAQTSKLSLPRTFPFGKSEPYLVTQDMVH